MPSRGALAERTDGAEGAEGAEGAARRAFADREAIREALTDYFDALGRGDWPRIADGFTPDADLDYGTPGVRDVEGNLRLLRAGVALERVAAEGVVRDATRQRARFRRIHPQRVGVGIGATGADGLRGSLGKKAGGEGGAQAVGGHRSSPDG